MQSNYEQLHRVITELGNELAINYGISPNQFRMTSQVSSGFALQMENIRLDRNTLEQQAEFKGYERELFNMIRLVSEYYSKKIDDTFNIDFKEPFYPTDKTTSTQNNKELIDLGLISSAEILMNENPDLTEAEAIIKVKNNLSARNEMLQRINSFGMINQNETRAKLGL
jgi:hypothetical protein